MSQTSKFDQSHRKEHSTSSNEEKMHLAHLSSLMTPSFFQQGELFGKGLLSMSHSHAFCATAETKTSAMSCGRVCSQMIPH